MYYILGLMIVIIILGIGIMLCDSNRFIIRHYRFKNKKITGSHRYVFISDLHNKVYGKNHEKLMGEIDKIAPEAVFIGGDMLVGKLKADFEPALGLLRQLSAKYRIYYANGNHEQRIHLHPEKYKDMDVRYEEELKKLGIERLINEKVILPSSNLVIYGLEIGREYYRHFKKRKMEKAYLAELLGEVEEEKFSVLLAHNPDYFEEYADYGADLVLSGHVHGGIADLPFLGGVISPALCLFPQYDGGLFEEGRTSMVLSRGLGVHTIPVRFMNPGELIVLDLQEG